MDDQWGSSLLYYMYSVYFLKSGHFEISRKDPKNGGSIVLKIVDKNTLVGEMAILLKRMRSATVVRIISAKF